MGNELPLVEFKFGWGRIFRLYRHYLDVHGTYYALTDLTYIHLIYRHVMGVPSARLELHFGKNKLVLPGIAAVEDAEKTLKYVMPWLQTLGSHAAATPGRPSHDQPEHRQVSSHSEDSRQGETRQALLPTMNIRLPEMAVPLYMLPGEYAHYITDAALCHERNGKCYPVVDQGMLILTNRRVIYMGRQGQVMLDHACVLHVSRLRNAIALQADHWQERKIFEMRRPLECAMYLEYILQRFQRAATKHACSEGPDVMSQELGERIGCGNDRHIDGAMESRL